MPPHKNDLCGLWYTFHCAAQKFNLWVGPFLPFPTQKAKVSQFTCPDDSTGIGRRRILWGIHPSFSSSSATVTLHFCLLTQFNFPFLNTFYTGTFLSIRHFGHWTAKSALSPSPVFTPWGPAANWRLGGKGGGNGIWGYEREEERGGGGGGGGGGSVM